MPAFPSTHGNGNRQCISWKNTTDLITLGLSVAGMGMAGKSLAKDRKALKAVSQGNVNVKPAAVSNSTAANNSMAGKTGSFKMNLQMFAKKSGSKTKTLYHYTNEKGMNAIVESQKLNPSLKANNPKDARYGNGQYLSDIQPSNYSPAQLVKKFINVPNKYKYTHYVEIDVTDLEVIQGRDGVFVIPNESPLDLIGRIVSTGQVGKN